MGILDYFKKPEYLYHGTRLKNIPQIQELIKQQNIKKPILNLISP